MCSSCRCDDLFTPVSVPLGLQCFIQIGLIHKHDKYKLDSSVWVFYVLNLKVFNQFNKLKIRHSSAKSRQQLFKHMYLCRISKL